MGGGALTVMLDNKVALEPTNTKWVIAKWHYTWSGYQFNIIEQVIIARVKGSCERKTHLKRGYQAAGRIFGHVNSMHDSRQSSNDIMTIILLGSCAFVIEGPELTSLILTAFWTF